MIEVIGISHKLHAAEIRENLFFTSEQAYSYILHALSVIDIEGMVLLSTCNRTEMYFESHNPQAFKDVWNECLRFKGVDYTVDYYHYTADKCVSHIFEVAAGLDSLLVGEYQILGQLKDAYRLSVQHNCSSPHLSRVFHKAFEAGKKIRNIQKTDSSYAKAAVELVRDFFYDKKEKKILVFGAGSVAESLVENLTSQGFSKIVIFNRSYERAKAIALKFDVEVISENQMNAALRNTDIVFAATSALYPILLPQTFQGIARKIICFDLGMPRNIDERVKENPFIQLVTIDNLHFEGNAIGYKATAQQIIHEMLGEYNFWLETRNLSPFIREVQSKFDAILEKRLNYLKTRISASELDIVEETGSYLKEKFLNSLIAELKGHREQINTFKNLV